MKKVLCCIPTLGKIRIELAHNLYAWKAHYGDFFDVYSTRTRPLSEARNDCVKHFLKSDASWLFFVDSDAVPQPNIIEKLLSHGFDKKIISGLCNEMKVDSDKILKVVPMALEKVGDTGRPYQGEYRVLGPEELGGLIPVDAAGTICVMIHRSVFSNVEPPWFDHLAEDFYFYEKAKEAGEQTWVDCDTTIKHFKEVGI